MVFYAAMVNAFVPIQKDKTMHMFEESPITTDAKSLARQHSVSALMVKTLSKMKIVRTHVRMKSF